MSDLGQSKGGVERGSEAHWERLAVRMLCKVCPEKERHSHKTGEWNLDGDHCPKCGISRDDFDGFIMGDKGNPDA